MQTRDNFDRRVAIGRKRAKKKNDILAERRGVPVQLHTLRYASISIIHTYIHMYIFPGTPILSPHQENPLLPTVDWLSLLLVCDIFASQAGSAATFRRCVSRSTWAFIYEETDTHVTRKIPSVRYSTNGAYIVVIRW